METGILRSAAACAMDRRPGQSRTSGGPIACDHVRQAPVPAGMTPPGGERRRVRIDHVPHSPFDPVHSAPPVTCSLQRGANAPACTGTGSKSRAERQVSAIGSHSGSQPGKRPYDELNAAGLLTSARARVRTDLNEHGLPMCTYGSQGCGLARERSALHLRAILRSCRLSRRHAWSAGTLRRPRTEANGAFMVGARPAASSW